MKKLCCILVLASCLAGAASAGDMIGAAGSMFLDSAGGKSEAAPSAKVTAFYFSAHWCPPCKTFTPKLVSFYSELKQDGADFEIIFVSSDKSEAEMMQYMQEAEMPWPAVPFRSKEAGALQQIKQDELDSKGIPALVVVRGEQIITKDGRRDVEQMSKGAYQKWLTMEPETYGDSGASEKTVPAAGKSKKVRSAPAEAAPAVVGPPPPPEKKEMRMNELKAQLLDLDGKVIETSINYVSSFEQVDGKRYRAYCGCYGSSGGFGSESVLIPEEGKEFFQDMAKKNSYGSGFQTVYLRVRSKNPISIEKSNYPISLEAVGTRYNKSKDEYSW